MLNESLSCSWRGKIGKCNPATTSQQTTNPVTSQLSFLREKLPKTNSFHAKLQVELDHEDDI